MHHCKPAVSLKVTLVHRYLEFCGSILDDDSAQKKLEPTALSCILNTAACKLKLKLWQEALESCDEVTWDLLTFEPSERCPVALALEDIRSKGPQDFFITHLSAIHRT